jgi:hypothetical protein
MRVAIGRERELAVRLSRAQALVFGGAGIAGGAATAAIALILWRRMGASDGPEIAGHRLRGI